MALKAMRASMTAMCGVPSDSELTACLSTWTQGLSLLGTRQFAFSFALALALSHAFGLALTFAKAHEFALAFATAFAPRSKVFEIKLMTTALAVMDEVLLCEAFCTQVVIRASFALEAQAL